jgi:hypothetical protein
VRATSEIFNVDAELVFIATITLTNPISKQETNHLSTYLGFTITPIAQISLLYALERLFSKASIQALAGKSSPYDHD